MNKEFFDALISLESENNINADELIERVKDALLKAAKRAYPDCEEYISVEIDTVKKKFEMFMEQTVVDDEPTYYNEVNVHDARKINPLAEVGETIKSPLNIDDFSRAAAITAKQAIHGDLREINKQRLLERFADKEHECVTAVVTQVEPNGTATVMYDDTELYLLKPEQIPGEELEVDQNVKIYITDIINKTKKPIIRISRKRKELVKRLFELEVPEIYDGTVEIKSISREAGARTKIAVWSKDKNVDPVGACIGPNRTRINAIVKELNGEKIDIIIWDEDPEVFIAKALAPAKTVKIVIIPGEVRSCIAVVPDGQLSLAIGNKGQNAKLAAKLTGYKIDIKSESDPETEKALEAAEELIRISEEEQLFAEENEEEKGADLFAEEGEPEMIEEGETDLLSEDTEESGEEELFADEAAEAETTEETAASEAADENKAENGAEL